MKKTVVLALVIFCMMCGMVARADSTCNVTVNGVYVEFDQPPIIKDSRTYVPLRAVGEQMGASVKWNDDTRTVTIIYKNTGIALEVGNKIMTVRDMSTGAEFTEDLEVPPIEYGGRVLSPLRAIMERLGCTVGWDQASYTVTVTTDDSVGFNNNRIIILGE